MNKTKLNYWVDVMIAVAFVISAITGLAFLVMGSGGYQGGRNSQFLTTFLGLERAQWSDLHTLGSLVMISGVFMHLVLHWNWIVCVTRRMIARPVRPTREAACEVTP
ncbi:MAG: DUF4405 domain-containing protein [Anaerolineae bacterium]